MRGSRSRRNVLSRQRSGAAESTRRVGLVATDGHRHCRSSHRYASSGLITRRPDRHQPIQPISVGKGQCPAGFHLDAAGLGLTFCNDAAALCGGVAGSRDRLPETARGSGGDRNGGDPVCRSTDCRPRVRTARLRSVRRPWSRGAASRVNPRQQFYVRRIGSGDAAASELLVGACRSCATDRTMTPRIPRPLLSRDLSCRETC